jgi:hypothetical protein
MEPVQHHIQQHSLVLHVELLPQGRSFITKINNRYLVHYDAFFAQH